MITKDRIASTSSVSLLLLLASLAAIAWDTGAQAAQYPITGNARFQIGDELPLPIGDSDPPEGKIYAQADAVVSQAVTGRDPRKIRIRVSAYYRPRTPRGLLPLFGNQKIFQIMTGVSMHFPVTSLRPGGILLNVLQQSGRTGPPTVAWCPGQPVPTASYNPSCATKGAGPLPRLPGIVRYRKTANQFGGPLSGYMGGTVDLALNPLLATLPCSFNVNPLCKAFFAIGPPLQTIAIGGPFGRRTITPGPAPSPGRFNVVATTHGIITYITPTGFGPGVGNDAESWGGPWTTGELKNSAITKNGVETFTLAGFDNRVGGVGVMHLVAGAVSNRAASGPNANRGWLNITVPEPAAAAGAASALLLLAACHRLVRCRCR